MRKFRVTPKHIGRKVPPILDGIEHDDERRLRNALRALATLDDGWEAWVMSNAPESLGVPDRRRIVERQARALVAAQYKFMGPSFAARLIETDYYFLDNGDLKGHL